MERHIALAAFSLRAAEGSIGHGVPGLRDAHRGSSALNRSPMTCSRSVWHYSTLCERDQIECESRFAVYLLPRESYRRKREMGDPAMP